MMSQIKKHKTFFLLLVLVMLIFLDLVLFHFITTPRWQTVKENGITISVRMNKKKYKSGDQVIFYYKIKNNSKQSIYNYTYYDNSHMGQKQDELPTIEESITGFREWVIRKPRCSGEIKRNQSYKGELQCTSYISEQNSGRYVARGIFRMVNEDSSGKLIDQQYFACDFEIVNQFPFYPRLVTSSVANKSTVKNLMIPII